jgi:hypothetical protein
MLPKAHWHLNNEGEWRARTHFHSSVQFVPVLSHLATSRKSYAALKITHSTHLVATPAGTRRYLEGFPPARYGCRLRSAYSVASEKCLQEVASMSLRLQ